MSFRPGHRGCRTAIAICLCAAAPACPVARAATVAGGEALTIELTDDEGRVAAVTANGVSLPVLPGAQGLVAVRTGHPVAPADLLSLSFDEDDAAWTSALNADWDSSAAYVSRIADGGVDGSGHLLLGDGATEGAGMALSARPAVPDGAIVRISWQARTADTATTQILALRAYDGAGRDITNEHPAPPGWFWSSTSMAHVQVGMNCAQPDTWESFESRYAVPPGTATVGLSLRHWTAGDHRLRIDDLHLAVLGGVAWDDTTAVLGPLIESGDGVTQSALLPDAALHVSARVESGSDAVLVKIDLQDVSDPPSNRPVQLFCSLPVALDGWTWWDDIDAASTVAPGRSCANTFPLAGHDVSFYPYACVAGDGAAVAMGVPMDETVAQRFSADTVTGLRSTWDLCLSPITVNLGSGHAEVSLFLMAHDPDWGFRATTDRYHKRFPAWFEKRTHREGAWLYPVPPSQIPEPEDYGFAFFETYPLEAGERAFAASRGIGIYHYVEPWISWQSYGSTTNKPPLEERVALLETWAAAEGALAQWFPDGGTGNSGHLRLGDGLLTGAGMATAAPFGTGGADALRITWYARAASTETKQILCLRLFDEEGRDITESVPAPHGWGWTATSQAHAIWGIACAAPDTWERFEQVYAVPPVAASARVSLRYWIGGDPYLHIDDLAARNGASDTDLLVLRFESPDDEWTQAYNAAWDDAGPRWLRAPRQETAEAVLRSSPLDENGIHLADLHPYLWHEWGVGTRHQAWPVNPDPDLPEPNAFTLYRDYWVRERLEETEGVYFDSVNASIPVGGWENHRVEHHVFVDHPLTYSLTTGGPVQIAPQSHAEFMDPIVEELHAGNRLAMVNLFSEAMRFHAHRSDIMGSEVGVLVESDARSRLRRTLAGTRIVTNLLQWGWFTFPEYASSAQIEEFIRGQLFWGFYPAISSAGGLPDGGTPDRYFHHPELYERDRPLFRTYMPIIRDLSTAGWAPVTRATSAGDVQIERFGSFDGGRLFLTVRGRNVEGAVAQITLDAAACDLPRGSGIAVRDRIAAADLPFTKDPGSETVEFAVDLDPGEVAVIEIAAHPASSWELR